VSVRLGEVIAVLDEAYPPQLAHDWDSVGLVCGDPDEQLESVTLAVDATDAVVDTVGPGGLLVAHHPLVLLLVLLLVVLRVLHLLRECAQLLVKIFLESLPQTKT
jgi:hypothetical protein